MKLKTFFGVLACTIFAGCSSMQMEDFAGTTPEFVPQKYFTQLSHIKPNSFLV